MKRQRTGAVLTTFWIAVVGTGCASAPTPASSQGASPRSSLARGPQLEGPDFDRGGADFAGWLADFEKKVHFNWKPPTYHGYGGGVEFQFTVERNGSILTLEMLGSSGTEAMDHAAREALTRSRFEALPPDFPAARVTMRITFHYNTPPGE